MKNAMITAYTVRETTHGNPGERRALPAGIRIEVRPASNLPADSPIKWWAHPLSTGPCAWPKDMLDWAEGPGVGLGKDDVSVEWNMVAFRLVHAVTEYDCREKDRADQGKRGAYHNPHALPQYLSRVDEVVADMERGAPVRAAILRGFCGRLATVCLQALGLPAITKEEAVSGRLCYSPITPDPTPLAEFEID